jgi:predicted RNA binding protein YcfA (HicA-like mRNA interferase family)
MKREALLAHLRSKGCVLVREGGSHSIWRNPANGEIQAVPRHKEVKRFTTKSICRRLGIVVPKGA